MITRGGWEEAAWRHFAQVMEIGERVLAAKFEDLLRHLDKRRRLVLGAGAQGLGVWGRAGRVSVWLSRKTVSGG